MTEDELWRKADALSRAILKAKHLQLPINTDLAETIQELFKRRNLLEEWHTISILQRDEGA